MGMLVRNVLHDSTSMGSPGIEEIRWIKPVRAGATITMQQRILDKRLSASRPDRGIVTTEWVGTDESGETVITVRSKVIFGLRNRQAGA